MNDLLQYLQQAYQNQQESIGATAGINNDAQKPGQSGLARAEVL